MLYWTPRVLSIIFVFFLSLFSLDVFSLNLGLWQTAVALFMHNIPTLVLTAILVISWKYEIVGGIAFISAGLLYILLIMQNQFEWYMLSWIIIITSPAFLIGALFLINWFKKNNK